MSCFWYFSKNKGGKGVVAAESAAGEFVRRVLVVTMGCFLGCFGVKDASSQLVAAGEPTMPRTKNSLSSLFVSDDDSLQKGREGKKLQPEEHDVREVKDQAKFLKACGTLPETPLDASERGVAMPSQNGKQKFSDIISLQSPKSSSIEKMELDKPPVESPKPVKIWQEIIIETDSIVDSPSSCMTDGHNNGRCSITSIHGSDLQNVTTPRDMQSNITNYSGSSSVSTGVFAPTGQCKNKTVSFDCDYDRSPYTSNGSSSATDCKQFEETESANRSSVSKPLPFPTPAKLTSDLQTPSTIFPAYLDNVANGKTARVRSQYVCPILNPITSLHQWNELKDEYSDFNHSSEFYTLNDKTALVSAATLDMVQENLSVEQEMKEDAGLASWFRPVSSKQDDNKKQFGSSSGEDTHHRKTPGDRPILGMVAAHWNDDEISRVSPKWWDGNGIPNSTNKYKEDQKVSWHATPFEERLEKALSEETFVCKRMPFSRTTPGDCIEAEESDTALSHLQSAIHANSVVSF